jgi:hypothetical protein
MVEVVMSSDSRLPFGTLSPEALFSDITYFSDPGVRDRIQAHCLAHGCVAGIEFDHELHLWVWHVLYWPQQDKMLCKDVTDRFPPVSNARILSERAMTATFAAELRQRGIAVDCYVSCGGGVADIVSRGHDVVYELKRLLSREVLFHAVGQVLIYKESINPSARAVIVGQSTLAIQPLLPYIARLGIEVIFWPRSED